MIKKKGWCVMEFFFLMALVIAAVVVVGSLMVASFTKGNDGKRILGFGFWARLLFFGLFFLYVSFSFARDCFYGNMYLIQTDQKTGEIKFSRPLAEKEFVYEDPSGGFKIYRLGGDYLVSCFVGNEEAMKQYAKGKVLMLPTLRPASEVEASAKGKPGE